MNRNIYSLLLMDDVIRAVDELAYSQNTSRSNLVNQILAERLAVKTPEQRMRDIFSQIQMLMEAQTTFQMQLQPSDAMLSVRTSLAYKYNPTVRYSVILFRNDPDALGELRVSARTQSEALLGMLESFFRLWDKLECAYLKERYPAGAPIKLENGRLCRTFCWPQTGCTNEQLGGAINDYIRRFDRALKSFFAIEENNWQKGIQQIGCTYEKDILNEKILL